MAKRAVEAMKIMKTIDVDAIEKRGVVMAQILSSEERMGALSDSNLRFFSMTSALAVLVLCSYERTSDGR